MPAFFITGTDTGVGKTFFTCWLTRVWRAAGHDAVALKPIATGDREDALLLRAATDNALSLDEINPVHFVKAAAPLLAACAEHASLDFTALNKTIAAMRSRFSHLAVEGVGGWRVPLAAHYSVREWALDLDLPVVVVARGTLGTLNHTLLTVDSIRSAGLVCTGVVVNAGSESRPSSPDFDLVRGENIGLLRELLGLPVFEFDRRAQASGDLPVWLGGKEV
jgi:dethiobiotin synthetase